MNKEKLQTKASIQNPERLGISSALGHLHEGGLTESMNNLKEKGSNSDTPKEDRNQKIQDVKEDKGFDGKAAEDDALKIPFVPDATTQSNLQPKPGRPTGFSENAGEEMTQLFNQFIDIGISPTLNEIQNIVKNSKYLGKHTTKEIKSRLAYIIKQCKPEPPSNPLPDMQKVVEEWLITSNETAEYLSQFSSTRRSAMKWDKEDSHKKSI